MTTKSIIVSCVSAILLAVFSFEIAIFIDGVLSGYLHHSAELVFGANIFVNENSTLSISLLSSAIAHTIAVLLVVYTALWMVHVDKILFISSYSIATVAYLSYKAGFFVGIDSVLILFIGIRFIFHVMWVPVWFYLFGRKSQKQ